MNTISRRDLGNLLISRRAILAGAAATTLAGCNDSSPPPPPRPVTPPAPAGPIELSTLQPVWLYGTAQPQLFRPPNPPGFSFDFPTVGDIHYLEFPIMMNLTGKQAITLNWSVNSSVDVVFGASQADEGCPCHVSIALQETGDNFTGQGVYQYYRWFSHDKLSLDPGSHTYSIPLDVNSWGPVGGLSGPFPVTPAQGFSGCLASCQGVMLTFGGQYFAGHGLYVKQGSASMVIKNLTIS